MTDKTFYMYRLHVSTRISILVWISITKASSQASNTFLGSINESIYFERMRSNL